MYGTYYWFLSFWLSHKSFICIPLSYHACYISYTSYSLSIYYSKYIWLGIQVTKLLIILSSPTSNFAFPLRSNIGFCTVFSNTPQHSMFISYCQRPSFAPVWT
jgi:hypothetical protein